MMRALTISFLALVAILGCHGEVERGSSTPDSGPAKGAADAKPVPQQTKPKEIYNTILAVAITPDSKRAVTISADGSADIWDLAKAQQPKKPPDPILHLPHLLYPTRAATVAFDRHGKRFYTTKDNDILEVLAETGKVERTFKPTEKPAHAVSMLAVTADGKRLVAMHGIYLKVWDLESGECIRKVDSTAASPVAGFRLLALSPDSTRALTGTTKGGVWEWDLSSGKLLHALRPPLEGQASLSGVAYDLTGAKAMTTHVQSGVQVWDLATEKVERAFGTDEKPAHGLAVCPTDETLLAVSHSDTVRIWKWQQGRLLVALPEKKDLNAGPVFTPDGKKVLLAGGRYMPGPRFPVDGVIENRVLLVWDIAAGEYSCIVAFPHLGER